MTRDTCALCPETRHLLGLHKPSSQHTYALQRLALLASMIIMSDQEVRHLWIVVDTAATHHRQEASEDRHGRTRAEAASSKPG